MNTRNVAFHSLAALAMLPCATSSASVTTFTTFAQWQSSSGSFTTITFAEVPPLSFLTTQYGSLGVTFTKGNDYTAFDPVVFPLDGYGATTQSDGTMRLSFSQPMAAIGVHFAGNLRFQLFSQGFLIYTSSPFSVSGGGHFRGLVSTESFDSAVLYDHDPTFGIGAIFIDNLYFGPPIPGPGVALPLLVAALLGGARRRR